MSASPERSTAKPGTACLGCRRRKLKCNKDPQGCSHCIKSELPCVYPAPELGVRKKRGPYRKDKPALEKHLEHLVRYLEPQKQRALQNDASGTTSHQSEHIDFSGPKVAASSAGTTNSEHLVQDALIALTQSATQNSEARVAREPVLWQSITRPNQRNGSSTSHPPPRTLFEHWQLFVRRVDPVTKIIHCPSVSDTIIDIVDELPSGNVSAPINALLYSIYFASVSTCTGRECRQRFGESQSTLLQQYGQAIEATISDYHAMPVLELLQALVLYITCIRRQDNGTSILTLFSLATRTAQMMGLDKDPGDRFDAFEAEMRRRLWWHICGLENRAAEEAQARATPLMQGHTVELPGNFDDLDLYPGMATSPSPRKGFTHMYFCLLRMEVHRLIYAIHHVRRKHVGNGAGCDAAERVEQEQRAIHDQAKKHIETNYLQHLDCSRRYDWYCSTFVSGMLHKAELIIDHPYGILPSSTTPLAIRTKILNSSVNIIKGTYVLAHDEKLRDLNWFFRGYNQWHALSIIIAELSLNPDGDFIDHAWSALDPILADWDEIFESRKEDPAWNHVNTLIQRARLQRQHRSAMASLQHAQREMSSNNPRSTTQSITMQTDDARWQSSADATQQSASHEPLNGLLNGGCAFADHVDFDMATAAESIDFGAFDQVFNNQVWDFDLGDINMAAFN